MLSLSGLKSLLLSQMRANSVMPFGGTRTDKYEDVVREIEDRVAKVAATDPWLAEQSA